MPQPSDQLIRNPLPSSSHLYNAAYGNGVYVIVGDSGTLITSGDLQTWNIVNRTEHLENVVFDGTKFVISGLRGDILVSMDGTNWTVYASGTELSLSGLAYGNGRYVAVGENGATATSTDDTNWVASSTGDANWYYGATYGAGRFVAVSYDANNFTAPGSIATTTNGMDWTLVELPAGAPSYIELYDVGYGGGRFTATGYYYDANTFVEGVVILTSTDGLDWSVVNDPDILNSNVANLKWLSVVRHDGSRWVGAGDNSLVMTSTDGLDWSVAPAPPGGATDFYGLAFGPLGTTVVGRAGRVFSTLDLSTWGQNSSGFQANSYKIAFDGSRYLVSGQAGGIFTSEDGISWTQQNPTQVGGILTSVAFGNGYWVVGSDANSDGRPLTTSQDGITWALPTTLPGEFTACRGVAFVNGVFVALPRAGANSLILSTNAQDWSGMSDPWFTANMQKILIEPLGGQFFAWNRPEPTVEVKVSPGGVSWITRDTGTTNTMLSAAYTTGRWVMVGFNGAVITTTNLTDWNEQVITFGANAPVTLQGVAYGAGHWVIVGRGQQIWSSTDGVNWEEAFTTHSAAADVFSDVMFDGSSFWTCGSSGVIYQSEPVTGGGSAPTLAIQRTANPLELLLRIDGTAGEKWDLVYSAELPAASWDYLSTLTLTNDTHFHMESVLDGTMERYFRLRAP